MQFGYDPGKGLVLPAASPHRYRAGPNPMSPPSIEPSCREDLQRIAFRTGRQLRFHWMVYDRIWSVQVLEPDGRWQSVVANYDEDGQWDGCPYPYRPVDKRFLDEICEADLRIKHGTGDTTKDKALNDASIEARGAADAAKKHTDGAEMIEAVVTGGDHRRFFRLLGHEQMHNGPGVRFQEYFQVARETPLPDKVTPDTE